MVVAVVLSVLGCLLVRRKVPIETLRGGETAVAAILGAVGTLFAVLLAFTIVMVWDHFANSADAVEAEATHIGDLSRLAKSFEPADEQRIRRELIKYITTVVRDEWPAMAKGHDDRRAWQEMTQLWIAYRGITPRDQAVQVVYAESMTHLTIISDARRKRLHALHDDVPGLMWIALIAGGVLVVGIACLLAPQKNAVHVALVGTLAALITLNLFVIYELDNPFRGWPRIGAEGLQQELRRIQSSATE